MPSTRRGRRPPSKTPAWLRAARPACVKMSYEKLSPGCVSAAYRAGCRVLRRVESRRLHRHTDPRVARSDELVVRKDPIRCRVDAARDVEPLDDDGAVEAGRIRRAVHDRARRVGRGRARRHAPLAVRCQRSGGRVGRGPPGEEELGLLVADGRGRERRRRDRRGARYRPGHRRAGRHGVARRDPDRTGCTRSLR